VKLNVVPRHAPKGSSSAEAEKYCAYNLTRERFVATGIEALDGSNSDWDAALHDIGLGGGRALWIAPFREIVPTSVRQPVDLIILDSDCAILNTAESFPLAGSCESSELAASVLVLPSGTLTQGAIRVGDRLVIAVSDEMKQVLQRKQLAENEPRVGIVPSRLPKTNSAVNPVMRTATDRAVKDESPRVIREVGADETNRNSSSEVMSTFSDAPEPAVSPLKSTQQWKKEAPKNWFMRLLLGEPPDPRNAARNELQGLIAFFFTGGAPKGQPVRDISRSGLYVVTSERWYQGTVVRMTLTDRHNPTAERSITVNTKVVRIGSDGVGLEFILAGDGRRHGKAFELTDQSIGVGAAQIDDFIRVFQET
jgi:hypothetical protein